MINAYIQGEKGIIYPRIISLISNIYHLNSAKDASHL